MKKKLQVVLTEDTWTAVESITKEANESFEVGTINFSDVINEMIISSKVDIKGLQIKHTDVRRSLRVMAAQKIVDIDALIKSLNELKTKSARRKTTSSTDEAS